MTPITRLWFAIVREFIASMALFFIAGVLLSSLSDFTVARLAALVLASIIGLVILVHVFTLVVGYLSLRARAKEKARGRADNYRP